MAEGYASSLIEALRGAGIPGATMGGGVEYLDFPWMQNTTAALRPRVQASMLKNPEKLTFTQHTPADPLKQQREQNALWDRQTGGPTGDQINPVAALIEANKDRIEPIETGNPVFNLEQNMPEEMRKPLEEFAFVGPTEMENKLLPAADMPAADAILAAREKGEPDPLTPELQALVDEQQQLLASSGRTMADLEAEYPASSFAAIEPAPAPPPPVVEEAPPARLDPRDYRLQAEPQPMFAGLIPPANPPPVSEEPQLADLLPPSAQPQPTMQAPTLREEIIAAMAEPQAPEPAAEEQPFSDAELQMLVALLEEEGGR